MINLAKFALVVGNSAASFAAHTMAFPNPLERTEYLKFTAVNSFAIAKS
ncbi:hypothetical protein SAMN05444141_11352 [Pseudovibrio denitrificans]|uniref:Uncharacterized protein n=1 Tax=Pseudovibrio denitrificans TaxID=258256 RepID=A0A1I7DYX6_9HYPH|nr:hypothetical protein SAMN05444141_11352 [Pseudovibrio denitrificans]